MIPIEGMKQEPYGLPLMEPAWFACVRWAIGTKEFRDAFKEETGLDLEMLANRNPIDKMIDEATGFQREIIVKFCDWVTVNVWGTEDDGNP